MTCSSEIEAASDKQSFDRPWWLSSVATVASFLIRSLSVTWRVDVRFPREPIPEPVLYAFHHGDQALLYHAFRQKRIVILSSLSRDGEIQAQILKRLGYGVIRGSSHRRGARALLEMARWIEEGWNAALAVDGPRGPARIVKPGIVTLAQRTQRPIVPGVARARWRKILWRTWDRYQVPFPFTRAVILLGDPIDVEPNGDADYRETIRKRLEERLSALSEEAERF